MYTFLDPRMKGLVPRLVGMEAISSAMALNGQCIFADQGLAKHSSARGCYTCTPIRPHQSSFSDRPVPNFGRQNDIIMKRLMFQHLTAV